MHRKSALVAAALAAAASLPGVPASAAEQGSAGGGQGIHPKPAIGAQAGIGGWTGGRGRATWVGPSWGVEAGVQLAKWLGVFASYSGQYNDGRDARVGDGVGVTNDTVAGNVRLAAPLGVVQPWVAAGLGESWTRVRNAHDLATPLRASSGTNAPVAGGVTIQLSKRWSIGAEGQYQIGLASSAEGPSDPNAGNTWSAALTVSAQP